MLTLKRRLDSIFCMTNVDTDSYLAPNIDLSLNLFVGLTTNTFPEAVASVCHSPIQRVYVLIRNGSSGRREGGKG